MGMRICIHLYLECILKENENMKLNLFEDKNIKEEHVDLYFSNMRPVISQIIDTVNSERPTFSGRPADEDLDDWEETILDPWKESSLHTQRQECSV